MEYDQIIRDLEQKKYKPVYFLTGEESYYIDMITDYIADNVLSEEEKGFNQTVLYGLDTDVESIITLSRRFPMMASHQVVIIREAQNIDKIEGLLTYLEKPLMSTILVINYKYKKLDGRTKFYKALKKKCVLFESKKLFDNAVPQWIINYLKAKQYTIEHPGNIILADYLGSDLNKIVKELEKLTDTLKEGESTITTDHIERNIGISKDYNNFEFGKALSVKDVLKANRIVNYFAKNQRDHHITPTIAYLYYFFSKGLEYHYIKCKPDTQNVMSGLKVNYYQALDIINTGKNYNFNKLCEIISLLREYDMKSKGVNSSSATAGDLLKELTYRILH